MSIEIVRPFRWDVTRRSQLGRLVEIGPAPMTQELLLELARCCARVLAFAGDSDLVPAFRFARREGSGSTLITSARP